MRLLLLGGVLVLAAGRALACPIAELPLHTTTDDSFDRPATRAVLELVGRAASLDAARAVARSPELGRELAGLSPIEAYVSAQAFRIAVRLRQLDCAVLRGAPIDNSLFTSIATEANDAIRALDASAPVVVYVNGPDASKAVLLGVEGPPGMRRPVVLLPPPTTPEQHLRTAHRRRVAAGVLFGISAIALGGAIAATVATAAASRSCRSPDELCELGVGLDFLGTVLVYAVALGTALPATLLLLSANQHERSARAPSLSWSASPTGASASLGFRF